MLHFPLEPVLTLFILLLAPLIAYSQYTWVACNTYSIPGCAGAPYIYSAFPVDRCLTPAVEDLWADGSRSRFVTCNGTHITHTLYWLEDCQIDMVHSAPPTTVMIEVGACLPYESGSHSCGCLEASDPEPYENDIAAAVPWQSIGSYSDASCSYDSLENLVISRSGSCFYATRLFVSTITPGFGVYVHHASILPISKLAFGTGCDGPEVYRLLASSLPTSCSSADGGLTFVDSIYLTLLNEIDAVVPGMHDAIQEIQIVEEDGDAEEYVISLAHWTSTCEGTSTSAAVVPSETCIPFRGHSVIDVELGSSRSIVTILSGLGGYIQVIWEDRGRCEAINQADLIVYRVHPELCTATPFGNLYLYATTALGSIDEVIAISKNKLVAWFPFSNRTELSPLVCDQLREQFDDEPVDFRKLNDVLVVVDSDFCMNSERVFVEPSRLSSLKGSCQNGRPAVRNYTIQQYCENIHQMITEPFCSSEYFFSCYVYSCYGTEFSSSEVCSGHGTCVGWDTCSCDPDWDGNLCETGPPWVIQNLGTFVAVLVSILFVVVLSVLAVVVIVAILARVSLQKRMKRQSTELTRLKQIEDHEYLLAEIEADKDVSTAHLRINESMFSVEFGEITVKKKIGQGGSESTVYLAEWKGLTVAFKCFRTETLFDDQSNFSSFESEVSILASVKHPFILSFFGATLQPPRVGILMEYCVNGDLKMYLPKCRKDTPEILTLSKKLRWLWEIGSSMAYIHSRNIIHRDLKCENVLLTESLETRLMDFGLSKIVSDFTQAGSTKLVGTSQYMAPEMVRGDVRYSASCDVYSFSILAYEVFTENFEPYGDVPNIEYRVANDDKFRPDVSAPIALVEKEEDRDWIVTLLESSWDGEPSTRPTFDEIVKVLTQHF